MEQVFQYASEGKRAIINALTGIGAEGITDNFTFGELASYINTLVVRKKTLVLSGTYLCRINNWQGGSTYIKFSKEFVEPPTIVCSMVDKWNIYASKVTTTGFTLNWGHGYTGSDSYTTKWVATGIGYDE